mmetsp:Transcript_26826/g.63051  ORF Transcript_26826/g.63051 Transcript_26826/m.63051 type:complete len:340 (+) Transcript_26826:59-1078(+)
MGNDRNKIVKNRIHCRRRITVVVVRHGERLDYSHRAAGKNWCQANSRRPWDPPLTQRGLNMAIQLGTALRDRILPEKDLSPISAVYSSPFLRCRETAAGIIQGVMSSDHKHQSSNSNRESTCTSPLKVRVEMGLSESINEDWYRSWSLPETDGTWGFKKKEIPHIDPIRDGMDPRALLPIENLLDWKRSMDDAHGILGGIMDHEYKSRTSLGGDYSFAGSPPNLETSHLQHNRIENTINVLTSQHFQQNNSAGEKNNEDNDTTVVLVAHGGIVSQFYVNLTSNDAKDHGFGKYCCFSIYQREEKSTSENTEKDYIGNEKWTPLVVNRILWDDATREDTP